MTAPVEVPDVFTSDSKPNTFHGWESSEEMRRDIAIDEFREDTVSCINCHGKGRNGYGNDCPTCAGTGLNRRGEF